MAFPTYKNTDRFTILPDGEYVGYIADCKSGYSKSGNPMWTLKLEFEPGVKVTDYLVLNQTFAWKMKALVDAVGLPYNGELDAWELNGLAVRVLLGQEVQTGNYPPKNVVQNYLVSEEPLPARKEPDDPSSTDDRSSGRATGEPVHGTSHGSGGVDDLPF